MKFIKFIYALMPEGTPRTPIYLVNERDRNYDPSKWTRLWIGSISGTTLTATRDNVELRNKINIESWEITGIVPWAADHSRFGTGIFFRPTYSPLPTFIQRH